MQLKSLRFALAWAMPLVIGAALLRVVELAVGGRGRVDDERAGIADVGEVAHELRRLDELHAGRDATLGAARS